MDYSMNWPDPLGPVEEATKALKLLHGDSERIEARVFIHEGGRDVPYSAFAISTGSLARSVPKLEEKGAKSYIVLNPVAAHKFPVCSFKRGYAAGDLDIVRRNWMFFDLDPERDAGISSSEEEKVAAYKRVTEIRDYLYTIGFPKMILADSGNGYHLIVRIDLPCDADSDSLVNRVLEGVGNKFPAEGEIPIHVDQTVGNASRLIKFYGTTSRKGDDTPERPHRMSRILEVPDEIIPASADVLESVATKKPEKKTRPKSSTRIYPGKLDLRRWLADYGVTIANTRTWRSQDGEIIIYIPDSCPFTNHPRGTDQGGFWQFPSGAIVYRCYHDSCRDYHTRTPAGLNAWHMVRDMYEERGKFRGYID